MTWDPSKMSPGIQLSNNNMTCVSGDRSCSHKTVLGTIPITHGAIEWEVVVNQYADCYSAVGIVGESFNYNGKVRMGIEENSWALGIYPGSHVESSPRRIQAPSTLSSGQVIKCVYDADEGTLVISVDGTQRASYSSISLDVAYIAFTVCESANGGYTLRNVRSH